MARIVVAGYMVRHPVAGNLYAFLQYVLGFERLGHQVVYVEESGWPGSCYDPTTRQWQDSPATGLGIVRGLVAEYGGLSPVCYVGRESGSTDGMSRGELVEALERADVLVNVGGVCWLPEFQRCQRRVLIDLDPMFTQIERFGAGVLHEYHAHFTYGANIGKPGCVIPTAGVKWRPLAPPVIPDLWELPPAEPGGPLTTVANWGAYGSVQYQGQSYGQKDREFMKLIDLPRRTKQPLELAVSGAPREIAERFRDSGWTLEDAGDSGVGVGVGAYRAFIARSRGELSPAKHAYVATRSGWFSDRSVCYLAAGRPVVLQDTGFSDWLPAGEGVLPFSTIDEAAAAIDRLNADYQRHVAAARRLVRDKFSYDVVLPSLVEP
jgi:hypothetical protein